MDCSNYRHWLRLAQERKCRIASYWRFWLRLAQERKAREAESLAGECDLELIPIDYQPEKSL